jgi:hypothetical protein
MSQQQTALDSYCEGSAFPSMGDRLDENSSDNPRLGFEEEVSLPDLPNDIAEAREVDWVIFTGRYPYVFDALRFGYGIGHREDSSYQWTPDEVDLPVHFLDNDFEDPSLDRFIDRVFEYQPEIAVVGDVYTTADLDDHLSAVEEIKASFPDINLVLVPKCQEVLDEIPSDIILGYPNGKSDIVGEDVAPIEEWRSVENRLHILGGPPLRTKDVIEKLTRRTLTGTSPADIVGLDSNRFFKNASQFGDYAAAGGGWHSNLRENYAAKRNLLIYSFVNGRQFWISEGVWPEASKEKLVDRSVLEQAAFDRELQRDQTGSSLEATELFSSPLPLQEAVDTPLLRTDETNAAVIEPLSQLSQFSGKNRWTPSGTLQQTGNCSYNWSHNPVCPACGANPVGPEAVGSSRSDGQDTAQVISYEHQQAEETNHEGSIPKEGAERLRFSSNYPPIYWVCSDRCQSRLEREPRSLFDTPADENAPWPDPTYLGTVTVQR